MTDDLDLPDDALLAQCRREAFRGPGPGGQKRNKTSNAVRLTHLATGIFAVAAESRSQSQNLSAALRRLRHRLALEIRRPAPRDPAAINLNISERSPDYPRTMSQTLDLLLAHAWSISATARAMAITTARLSTFLRRDEALWAEVNRQRRAIGLKSLI